MKVNELKKEYNEKLEALNGIKDTITTEELGIKLVELKEIKNKIGMLEEIEQLEVKQIIENKKVLGEKMEYNGRILNKLIKGTATEEEIRVYNAYTGQKESVPADGGYLVPETQLTSLYEYKRTLNNLGDMVNVVTVKTPTGKMPLEVLVNDKLVDITEGEEIPLSKITFGQTTWQTHDYGDLMAVTNQLLDDAQFNITEYIKRRIGKKSVRLQNEKVIEILKTFEKVDITKKADALDKMDEVIIKKLDPIFRQNGVIVTNQSGRLFLESLTDKQGRPLLVDSYNELGAKTYRGFKVVELTDEVLANDTTKVPFFIGSLNDGITKFDLKGLSLALSQEAGFKQNVVYLRAIERFDIKKIDDKAIVYVTVDTSK